jgi:hypothetical protein
VDIGQLVVVQLHEKLDLSPGHVPGAILLTGYLGGAVATHVHAGDDPGKVAFPVIFAAVLWPGLVLR